MIIKNNFAETPLHIAEIRRCKEYFLKLAGNTTVYFYILHVMVIILASFLVCLPLIVNAMTDWLYSYFVNFFFIVNIKK